MSFATTLPAVAVAFAFVLGSLFAAVLALTVELRASEQSDRIAARLADGIYQDMAAGQPARAQGWIDRFAPGEAVVMLRDGTVLAGEATPEIMEKGRHYPLGTNGEVVGELVMLRALPWQLPAPLTVLIASILVITLIAYLVANAFSQLVGQQIRRLASLIRHISFSHKSEDDGPPLVFSEFRRLRAAMVRRLRKLQNENSRLLNAAYTDERTGLGNSAELSRRLTQYLSRSSFSAPSAFIQIDVDAVMNGYDHDSAASFELHAIMAKRISHFVTEQQSKFSVSKTRWPVFAMPADDFGILVEGLGMRTEIMKFARFLLAHLKEPVVVGGKTIKANVFAGISMIPEDGQTPVDIRRRASAALDQARRKDGGELQFYSPKFDRQSTARKRLEAELRAGVEQKAFLPVFQPKIDLSTGKIVGAEALARWKLESGRIVSPGVFIPVAESCGLIGEIGKQVTRQACEGAARWHQMGFNDISIAVNVSPLQFESDDLGSMLINAMADAGLVPRLLQLEITESVAVTDPDRLRNVIGPLKSMGVRLAIDDFGTGHSNLAMLGRLPFDVFKIDRQFICNLHTDKQAPAIVEMILGMAETLGMETVAEGVETKEQEQFLRRRGCDQYQGYYFSPPVTLDRFIEMVKQNRRPAAA